MCFLCEMNTNLCEIVCVCVWTIMVIFEALAMKGQRGLLYNLSMLSLQYLIKFLHYIHVNGEGEGDNPIVGI